MENSFLNTVSLHSCRAAFGLCTLTIAVLELSGKKHFWTMKSKHGENGG